MGREIIARDREIKDNEKWKGRREKERGSDSSMRRNIKKKKIKEKSVGERIGKMERKRKRKEGKEA